MQSRSSTTVILIVVTLFFAVPILVGVIGLITRMFHQVFQLFGWIFELAGNILHGAWNIMDFFLPMNPAVAILLILALVILIRKRPL